jgi:glycosyltransferase involved in cell wall biosynthesis
MRVTHVITRLIVGGAQENTVDSVLGLRARHALDVDLISGPTDGPEGSLEPAFASCPNVLTLAPHLRRSVHPWNDWRALHELTRLLRQRRPDLVHTHSGKAGVLGRLAARRAGVPLIVHTVHGPSFGPFQGPLANTLFHQAERYVGRFTTHFVTVAQAMTREYLAAGIGRPEQFTFVPSGFALDPFLSAGPDPQVRARFGFQPEHFVVAKLARLAPLKGHEDLLEIAPALKELHPRIRFLLIGDGPARPQLEQTIRQRGLQNLFHLTGLVPPPDIPAILGAVDAVIHLSRREGLPRALTQALAAGKPVVAYDCDGAGEVCLSGETGFLVTLGDRASLISAVSDLVKTPELGARLGQRGRALIRAGFSVERMVDDLHQLYQKLRAARVFSLSPQRGEGGRRPGEG